MGSDFVPLVNDLSLLYQVLDDYQNLKSSSCAPLPFRSHRQWAAQRHAHICAGTCRHLLHRDRPCCRYHENKSFCESALRAPFSAR